MSSTPPAVASGRPTRLVALVIGLCWMVVLFDGLDMFMYGAVLPKMLDDPTLGLTPARGGEIGSYATFGMLVGALAAGTVTDWAGRKKVIAGCCALFSIASGVCAVAPSLGVFGFGRLLAGLGLGGLLPIAIAMVVEYAPRGRGNLMIGLLMTAHHVGGILASALSLWLVAPFGWRSLYWVGVVPLIIAVPLVARFLPESLGFLVARGRRDEAEALAHRHGVDLAEFPASGQGSVTRADRWAALRSLFQNSLWLPTLLFWLASFGGLLLVYGVNTWLPTMMRANGYELGSALGFLLVINLGGIVGMLVAGRIADRFGATRVSALWFALTAVGTFLLGARMPLPLTYIVVFLTGVWLFSAQTMVYAAVAGRFPTESRATALGWTAGMGRFGAVFGPWLGGVLLANHAQSWGFTVFAITAVFGSIMITLSGRGGRPSTPATPSVPSSRPGDAAAT
ncbi:aromatic acid/H+ symport family MFS transporter [Nonomuraea sp. NPDC049158]|uniref:MFS transporter n=1 Tax=Nonomuraea sp. NPDC049158 TaxID=3155649 RepID=UPI0033DDCA97